MYLPLRHRRAPLVPPHARLHEISALSPRVRGMLACMEGTIADDLIEVLLRRRKRMALERAIAEVRYNRFYLNEKPAEIKALPTDEEIAESGDGNAGTHLINMAAVAPEAYERLLKERAVEWGQPPQLQPVERCVEHVCHMMIVHCQGGSERTAKDFALSQRQVRIIGLNEG